MMIISYSCSVVDPDSDVPSYVHIDSISLHTDYPTQGSDSKKITDVWVIYDNQYLGTFPLPADIPVIGDGVHSFTFRAGVVENGIAGLRAAYPKYSSFDTTINLKPLGRATFSPSIGYLSGSVFPQMEDFDDAGISLTSTNTDFAPITITALADTNAFENNSGKVALEPNHAVFEVASSIPFSLPLDVPTYLELNYKCENDFTIGLFITTTAGVVKSELLTVRASGEWKKIYVSLNDLGGITPDAVYYKIYLHAEKNPSLLTADLYFDNLKIVF